MADISQIKLPDNNTYNFKDTLARGLKMYYGLCTSAGDTAAKVVTVGADQDFKLTVGALLMVKFTKSNTASNVTLNVNGTGAKGIYYNNAVFTGTSDSVCGYANANFIYMYGGTNWIWVGRGANSTYSAMSVAEGKTATATNSRTMRADYLKQIIQYHAVPSGQGVPAGGTAGQILAKADGTDYNTEWIDAPSGGGGVEKYTVATFDKETIPATDPFCWFIQGAKTTTATADYTSYLPLLKTQVSRSGWNYLSCYLFRKEESGSIYALFVGVDYYTLFVRKSASVTDNIWSCVTPMPGSSFLFSMSGATPTLKLIAMNYSATIDRPQIQCDPETLLADNTSNKIIRAKFIATVVFNDSSVDAVKSIQVPMVVGPNGSCFEFLYNNSGTLYRIVCKRTSSNTWTATATAL